MSMVTIDILYGNKLVNIIKTGMLCASLSNFADKKCQTYLPLELNL